MLRFTNGFWMKSFTLGIKARSITLVLKLMTLFRIAQCNRQMSWASLKRSNATLSIKGKARYSYLQRGKSPEKAMLMKKLYYNWKTQCILFRYHLMSEYYCNDIYLRTLTFLFFFNKKYDLLLFGDVLKTIVFQLL